ncbi:MAG TPA: CbiX/SirB N-terminal domain-containing protein [Nitrospira sp.]|nr:CbiX/SirB N-terminal domain-containing protein [Nitrospira sp.]
MRGVVLVGHGGIARDCPAELVSRFKRLEAQRRANGTSITSEEQELDKAIRHWPRTAATDPYQAGLEAVGAALRPLLDGALFALAYNEFCAPSVEESIEQLIEQGATEITVATTMFTPGGAHSEIEIPETLHRMRAKHPHVAIHYAWPFDASRIAQILHEQVRRFL